MWTQRSLEATRRELRKATQRMEQQDLQLRTLQGRTTAIKVARDEANHGGAPWTKAAIRRFKFLPGGPPDFANDALREMLDQAVLGADRRLEEALGEAATSRDHTLAAEQESDARVAEACRSFKDPNAEMAVRQAARAYCIRSNKSAMRLRAAMQRLEEEVVLTQSVRAADVRSLAARLVAQRDAVTASVVLELERAEITGANSIKAMEDANAQLRQELSTMREQNDHSVQGLEDKVASLEKALSETEAELREERRGRARDRQRFVSESSLMGSELGHLEAQVNRIEHELITLSREIVLEETDRAADAADARQKMAWERAGKAAEHLAMQSTLSQKMEANGVEAKKAKKANETLRGKLDALEDGLKGRLKALEAERASERKTLEAKIAHLERQLQAVRASKSVRRSYLYWSGMLSSKSPEKTYKMVEKLGLAEPEPWEKRLSRPSSIGALPLSSTVAASPPGRPSPRRGEWLYTTR